MAHIQANTHLAVINYAKLQSQQTRQQRQTAIVNTSQFGLKRNGAQSHLTIPRGQNQVGGYQTGRNIVILAFQTQTIQTKQE